MLDIKMVRANPDLVKQAMKTRNKDMDAQVDRVIAIDAERRELSAKADGVKARQNAASKDIARLKKEGGDASAIMDEMKRLAEEGKELSAREMCIRDSKILGKEPLLLDRASSYIGTLIDDLVTKGCTCLLYTSRCV